MPDPIIRVKNASVTYNKGQSNEVRSLDTASVEIFPQEYVIIHGPSGCGKSTLLYTIAGLQAPTDGLVMVGGKELAKMKKREKVDLHRLTIGMVFQAFYLIPSLSVLDNVCLPKSFKGDDPKERREAGMKLLQRFGIEAQAHKFPNQLSGGQKQRVAIARSLINNPEIILADEPVGNLDSVSSQNVLDILKELNEVDKKTVILVTHSDEHLHYGDRIITMKDGRIVSEEVNREKRPPAAVEQKAGTGTEEINNELKLLSRVFKGIGSQQAASLLVPYKAKQLMKYILAELTDEQIATGENFLKELIFRNITFRELAKKLDLDFERGGASWNKLRAENFSQRVEQILKESDDSEKSIPLQAARLADYLSRQFHFCLGPDLEKKFQEFLIRRLQGEIDFFGLQQGLDLPLKKGGLGLRKGTAEKVAREMEMIMLLKFAG